MTEIIVKETPLNMTEQSGASTPSTPLEKIQTAFAHKDAAAVYTALKETATQLGYGDAGFTFEPGAAETAMKQDIGRFLKSPINALDVVVPGGNIAFAVDENGILVPLFGHKSPPKLVRKWGELHPR